jgi:hypothetical protein
LLLFSLFSNNFSQESIMCPYFVVFVIYVF